MIAKNKVIRLNNEALFSNKWVRGAVYVHEDSGEYYVAAATPGPDLFVNLTGGSYWQKSEAADYFTRVPAGTRIEITVDV